MEKQRLKRDLADDPADNVDGEGWVRNTLCAVTRDIAAETRALRMLHWPDMRTPAQKRKDVEALAAGGMSAIAAAADAAEAVAVPKRRAARDQALAVAALAPPPAWHQGFHTAATGGGGGVGATAGPAALEGGVVGGTGVFGEALVKAEGGGGGVAGSGGIATALAVVAGETALPVEGGAGKPKDEGPETLSPRCAVLQYEHIFYGMRRGRVCCHLFFCVRLQRVYHLRSLETAA